MGTIKEDSLTIIMSVNYIEKLSSDFDEKAAYLYRHNFEKFDFWKKFRETYFVKLRYLGVANADSVLDVGCGPGMCIQVLRGIGCKNITGYDASVNMLEEAKKATEGMENISFHNLDACSVPELEKKFDVVVSFYLIPHFETETDLKNYFKSLKINLKEDGFALMGITVDESYFTDKYQKVVLLAGEDEECKIVLDDAEECWHDGARVYQYDDKDTFYACRHWSLQKCKELMGEVFSKVEEFNVGEILRVAPDTPKSIESVIQYMDHFVIL